ncbi:MAG: FtsX-like permease family protein [Bacillus sp. (in: Bacteria)]|nr:FtsX-like permease family protein [Bacillus sp. (in: firmicutes)]
MVESADKYFKDLNLADFRIVSPLGFQQQDMDDVLSLASVDRVQAGFWKDLFVTSQEGATSIVRLYSYNTLDHENGEIMNQLRLSSGRLPENQGEMVVQTGGNVPSDLKVGSIVTVSLAGEEEIKDVFKTNTFTVVGTIYSPMYISFERGQTNIGDGSIDFFAFINEADFQLERPTDLFLKTKESTKLIAYTEEYNNHLIPIQYSLRVLGKESLGREISLLEEELKEGQLTLRENRELAEQEFNEMEGQLLDAERAIQQAEIELKKEMDKLSAELEKAIKELETGEQQLEAGKRKYEESYSQWYNGKLAYEDGKLDLINKKSELTEAQGQLELGQQELDKARKQLDEGKEQLELFQEAIRRLKELRSRLANFPPSNQEEYWKLIDESNLIPKELGEFLKRIDYSPESSMVSMGVIDTFLAESKSQYLETENQYETAIAEYEIAKRQLEEGRREYEEGLILYKQGADQLITAEIQLEEGKRELEEAKEEIEINERKLKRGRAELVVGEEELEQKFQEAKAELKEGKEELASSWENFHEEKAIVLMELEKGEQEIKDAEGKLTQLPREWYVTSREGNPGYSGYGDDAERIGAVAKIFPLFFFLVAALVCLTTMTRMIDEERNQIGTLKALGYSTFTIALKYLLYALLSSIVGTIIGLTIGFQLFPTAIMNAYSIMYSIPERLTPFHWNYAIISLIIALLTTVVAALAATMQELKSTPAVLMQQRAPKPGKRIFLEKIPAFWTRLSFSHKVTFRNLFRYKRRFYMTVLGVAGCTALLIAGYGLSDSVNAIMGKQFTHIFLYDGQILLEGKSEKHIHEFVEVQGDIKEFMPIYNESVDAVDSETGRAYSSHLMIIKNPNKVSNFIRLQERRSQDKISIPDEGAIITEKLAYLLGVEKGDTFSYRDPNNFTYELTVAAIAENYLSHYIYVSPVYAATVQDKEVGYNAYMFRVTDMEQVNEAMFRESFMNHESIMSVYFNKTIAEIYQETMESLDYVVLILIISAASLAFVVMYNLTNINITERMREIATIKVLGFRNYEVDGYVYRENFILTLFGTIVGLLLGTVLHHYVIITMEIDTMMFGRDVHFSSYVWSILLTIVFTALVNIFMHYKLKNINMVESLKSVD